MNKQAGGAEMYIYEKHWFSKDKIFNISNIRETLERDSNKVGHTVEDDVEAFMVTLLDKSDNSSLYSKLDDSIKSKLGDDIKDIMGMQKDIKYVDKLLMFRDKKKNLFDKIKKQLILIKKIENNNFKKNKSLLIVNPRSERYDKVGDSKLLDNLINIFLRNKDLSIIEKKLLGCNVNKTINKKAVLFNTNNRDYTTCKYLRKSLECATCWRNVDLTKQAIGSVSDIATLMYHLVTTKSKYIDPKDSGMLDVFAPYMDNQDETNEPPQIEALFSVFRDVAKNMFYKKESSKISSKSASINDDKTLYDYLNVIKECTDIEKKKRLWEQYAVFMYGLIKVTTHTIKKIFEDAMNNSSIDYKAELETNVDDNLKNLENLLKYNLSKYIRIKSSKMNDNYGFSENQSDDLKNPTNSTSKKMIRINGGYESISTLVNFKDDKLLFSLKTGTKDYNEDITIHRLSNFIYGSFDIKTSNLTEPSAKININNIFKNINNNSKPQSDEIYIGGLTHKSLVGTMSKEIFIEYFNIRYNITHKEYNYLDNVLDKLKTSIHISDVRGIYESLNHIYNKIIDDTSTRDITVNIYFNKIKKMYYDFRYKSYVALKKNLSKSQNYKSGNNENTIRKRDEDFIIYSHYDIKAYLLKILSLHLYKHIQKEHLHQKLYKKLFNKKKLTDKYYKKLENIFVEVNNLIKTMSVNDKINMNTKNLKFKYDANANKLVKEPTNKSEKVDENKSEKVDENKSAKASKNKSVKASKNKSAKASKNKSVKASKNKSVKASKNKSAKVAENKSAEISMNKSIEISLNNSVKVSKNKSVKAKNMLTDGDINYIKKLELNLETSNKFDLSKLDGKTIYIPYCDTNKNMGLYDILQSYKNNRIRKQDIIKPSYINTTAKLKKYSVDGLICVTTSNRYINSPKFWRGINREYLEELITLSKKSKSEFKSNVYSLLTDKDYYFKHTINYYNNNEYSLLKKSTLEEYYNTLDVNKKETDFLVSLEKISELIK
jgi:hypothetical protein